MVEGLTEILRRVKEEDLIVDLGQRELQDPEGCGLDLRLASVHEIVVPESDEDIPFIEADGPAGLGLRKGVETLEVAHFNPDSNEQEACIFKPGDYRLVTTIECLNVPMDLEPVVSPRTSLHRSGLLLIATRVHPGYSGPLTMGLKNIGPVSVKLQMGARICNVAFQHVEDGAVAYRGQQQGGRVSHSEIERQV
jgi:deoxycytidine triphosphate deaminase